MVMAIKDGAVHRYNTTVLVEQQIQVGDFITAVNDVRGSTKSMSQRVQVGGGPLVLCIRRPPEFSVSLRLAEPGKLGLELDYLDNGSSLLVTGVTDGAVSSWNEAHPDKAVSNGDHIVSVNGNRGNAAQMV